MGLLERLFGYRRIQLNKKNNPMHINDKPRNENAIRILECGKYIKLLLTSDRYIARSEYSKRIAGFSSDVEFFSVLKKSGMFEDFCRKNNLNPSRINGIIDSYENIQGLIDEHNDKFVSESMIKEKEYLDNILISVDPNIELDEAQRRVVLTVEDY